MTMCTIPTGVYCSPWIEYGNDSLSGCYISNAGICTWTALVTNYSYGNILYSPDRRTSYLVFSTMDTGGVVGGYYVTENSYGINQPLRVQLLSMMHPEWILLVVLIALIGSVIIFRVPTA